MEVFELELDAEGTLVEPVDTPFPEERRRIDGFDLMGSGDTGCATLGASEWKGEIGGLGVRRKSADGCPFGGGDIEEKSDIAI